VALTDVPRLLRMNQPESDASTIPLLSSIAFQDPVNLLLHGVRQRTDRLRAAKAVEVECIVPRDRQYKELEFPLQPRAEVQGVSFNIVAVDFS
jgi:hypothetical protein